MILAVFFSVRVTQKHPAQNHRNVFRRKEGRSSPQPFSQNAHCNQGTYLARSSKIALKSVLAAKVRLGDATLKKLYANKDAYVSRANRRLDELIAEGWFLPEYADAIRRDIQAAEIP